jgi:hypothetical protein
MKVLSPTPKDWTERQVQQVDQTVKLVLKLAEMGKMSADQILTIAGSLIATVYGVQINLHPESKGAILANMEKNIDRIRIGLERELERRRT